MTTAIIGCGQSAQHWGESKFDLSIGCNDAGKWGYSLDQLVIVNFKSKFDKTRLETILKTKAKVFIHTSTWKKDIPSANTIKLTLFNGKVRDGFIYHSKTSPFVAISLAVKQGANDIVLYGIDMLNHKAYRQGTRAGDYEIKTYLKFFEELKKQGVRVWLGTTGSCFDNVLPLFKSDGVEDSNHCVWVTQPKANPAHAPAINDTITTKV